MILTVTLNPCIDHTVKVEGFAPGGTNRILASRSDAGGKGVNVSAALKNLGEDTRCLGLNFRQNGAFLTDVLRSRGIDCDFAEVNGALRTNIKIFDAATGVMSELNERGPEVGPEALEEFEIILERCLPGASLLILDGSVPPGVPAAYYRTLTERAAWHGVRTVLDARGELLLEGIRARPCLIKPNREELEEAAGERIVSRRDAVRAARRLIGLGAGMVCASLGRDGALLVTAGEAYFSAGADIPVRGVQGAGDALVAGMSYAMVRGLPLPEILRYGVAAAHGSLILEGTQMCGRGDFMKMLPRISAERMD
ncbi:1-phosphofructokinase [Caproiciproducens sp. NJN-50]|uniref:1-phosphofructokinase n=2 Tax=Acutalibacteraceae TaxID=3082771 RepID=UPI000FFE0847|nr:1-phosphofructokinase [Caproiciproducens sp. NJN-50]QAT50888.1 1-phosphofructokinase [Caproiciproducens sp. NJN-50]